MELMGHTWSLWDMHGAYGTYMEPMGHTWSLWDIHGAYGTYMEPMGHTWSPWGMIHPLFLGRRFFFSQPLADRIVRRR